MPVSLEERPRLGKSVKEGALLEEKVSYDSFSPYLQKGIGIYMLPNILEARFLTYIVL